MKTLDLKDGFFLRGHYSYGVESFINVAGGLYLKIRAIGTLTDENGTKLTRFIIIKE